jgi:hypothetical protein
MAKKGSQRPIYPILFYHQYYQEVHVERLLKNCTQSADGDKKENDECKESQDLITRRRESEQYLIYRIY